MSKEISKEQIEQHKTYVRKIIDSGLVINKEDSKTLDTILESAYSIIEDKEYNTNEEKDTAFEEYKELAMSFGRTLGSTLYNFGLDEGEYKLLRKIIMTDLEYDRQDIHFGLMVKDDYFNKVEARKDWTVTKFKKGVEILPTDINTVTRISHLFGQYKVKGLGSVAENYYEILKKITDVSKIFEYYNNMGEQMSKDASNWIQGLDEEAPVMEEVPGDIKL